jgi:hypothetical protein
MKKVVKFLLVIVLVVVVIGGGFLTFASKANFSEGNRTGRLMKFSKKGVIFKTQEGQLDVTGISRNSTGIASSTWDFSVDTDDTKTLEAIDKAMSENKIVKLHYEEKFFQFSWRGETKCFVTRVEEVHEIPANSKQ